jgi:cob(I)alamin adenosyltransferase
MARIYTRTGDGGETSLLDGSRRPKSDGRIALYGEVDELNSCLGVVVASLNEAGDGVGTPGGRAELTRQLTAIQQDLLELGALLADPGRSADLAARSQPDLPFSADVLESWIDGMEEVLPRLRQFILPGGSAAAAGLHLARTVCRRVERQAVALARTQPLPAGVLIYLNRLSDYLFVAARWANHAAGGQDVLWSRGGGTAGVAGSADDEGGR